MIEVERLPFLFELIPRPGRDLAPDALGIENASNSDQGFSSQPKIINMIIPRRMFTKPSQLDRLIQTIAKENVQKATHCPVRSRKPRLSIVGHAARAGSGDSKLSW